MVDPELEAFMRMGEEDIDFVCAQLEARLGGCRSPSPLRTRTWTAAAWSPCTPSGSGAGAGTEDGNGPLAPSGVSAVSEEAVACVPNLLRAEPPRDQQPLPPWRQSQAGAEAEVRGRTLEEQQSRKRLRGKTPPPAKLQRLAAGAAQPQPPVAAPKPPVLPEATAEETAAKKVVEELQRLTPAMRRNKWAAWWVRSKPAGHFNKHTNYAQRRDLGYAEWNKLDWAGVYDSVLEWVHKGMAFETARGAPAANNNARKPPPVDVTSSALLVSWNVEPCEDPTFLHLWNAVKAADPETQHYEELMDEIRELPCVAESWSKFLDYLDWLVKECWALEHSASHELSLHAKKGRWHFHATLSCINFLEHGRREPKLTVKKADLEWFAEKPVVRVASGKGRGAEAALQRMHCYNQWAKVGSLFRRSNYERGTAFVCKAAWTLHCWQLRKLSFRAAKDEILHNRDSVESAVAKLDGTKLAEVEAEMRRRKDTVMRVAVTKLSKFKKVERVEVWQRQYDPENIGVLTRFLFLVLEGETRFGKTRYACSRFGPRRTFVVNCQGVKQPSMAGWDPRNYDCIVLDEPGMELVETCKVFLQASLEGTDMYQSPTQRFTRWVWVYGVPIIVCTNGWVKDTDMSPTARWIRQNSVHVKVTDYLFEHESGHKYGDTWFV